MGDVIPINTVKVNYFLLVTSIILMIMIDKEIIFFYFGYKYNICKK